MAKAPDYGSYIPDANDPVFVTQAKAAQLAKEQPLYASGQGTPIFNNPGGIDGYVQFNSASSFGGDVGFTYNNKTRSVNILGNLNVGGFLNSKFYTNFSNLRISGGSEGDVMFTDGEGNLSWGNLDNYTTNAELTARFTSFQQGNVNFTGANVSLGNVSNLHIPGGSPNFILSTDGNGNLSWIEETGGGPNRFSIFNGTSNVAIPDTDGNVFVNVNDEYQWVYNTDGELLAGGQFVALQGELTDGAGYTFDETSRDTGMYSDSDGQLKFKTNNRLVAFYTDNDVHLYTKSQDYLTTYDWHLDRTGNLTLPTGGRINYSNGVSILSGLGGGGDSFDQSLNTDDDVTFTSVGATTVNVSQINGTNPGDELIIQANNHNWTFGTDGNLTLVDGTVIQGDGYGIEYPTASGEWDLHSDDGKVYIGSVSDMAYIDTYDANISVRLRSNENDWIFGADGSTQFPNDTIKSPIDNDISIETTMSPTAPPTTVVISGADFVAVNGTYTRVNNPTPTWEPAGYVQGTDSFIRFFGGRWEIMNPGFGSPIYLNTGTINIPLTQWTTNPPLGSVPPTGVYTYDDNYNHLWIFGTEGNLTLPSNTAAINYANGTNILDGLGGDGTGLSVTDFGEGFSLTASNKIVTNKLYSTNETQPTQHYRLELDTNGVVVLPDGSIINGSTIRGVAGTGELNYTGITIGPNSGNAEKTWMWVDHANAYISTNNLVNTWTFDNNGNFRLPVDGDILDSTGNSVLGSNLGNLSVEGTVITSSDSEAYINFDAGGGNNILALGTGDGALVKISTDDGATNFEFTASEGAGSIKFPDDTVQTTAYIGQEISPSVPRSDTAPVAANGQLWFNTLEGRMYIKYDGAWVDAAPLMVPAPELNPEFTSITFPDASVQTTAALGDRLVNGNREVVLDEDGALNLPRRGVIRNLDDTYDVNIVGAGPDAFAQLQWTTLAGAAEADPNGTDELKHWVYVEEPGVFIETNVNGAGDAYEWHFKTDGTTQFPNGVIKAPPGDNTISMQSQNSKNFVTVSDGQVLITAENTTAYNWAFGTNGVLTLPSSSYVESSDANLKFGSQSDVIIRSNAAGGAGLKAWTFGTDGNLTLPTNTSAINYANGQSILDGLGGGSSYGNSNVANYLPTHTGNVSAGNLSATGNVTGNYIIGNGSQLTGLPASYANSNVATFLASYGSNTITTTGNVSANYFLGNGSQLTGITATTATTAATVTTNAQPNITSVGTLSGLTVGPNSSIVLSGTSGYVKANSLQGTDGTQTIYLKYGSVAGAAGIATDLTVGTGGTGNLTANGTISASGNITGNYILGNGSQLTSITATTAATVTTNAQPNITSVGTLSSLSISGNITSGNILTGGLLSATGNITGGNIRTAGVMSSTGNLTSGNILTGGLLSATGNITGGNLITSGLLTVAGNISAGGNIIGASSNVSLVAGSYTWTFDNTSNAAFPGNLSATSNIRSNASFIATNVSGTISIGNTNSFMMGIGNANNYVQSYVHNQSNTSEASADMIVYGSSGTNDLGFMDMGMTSNNFSSSFFAVTGKSEGYMFMSGVAGTSGNMVIATNSTGSNNSIEFYVGGFGSAKGSNRPLLVSNTGISVTGNITGNTNGFAIGYRDVPQVAASNATIALTDAGKHFYSTTAGNFTLTIPNNATTTFSTGTAISIVVQAAGNILVNAASGVTLYMAGNSTAANRVVGTYGMATIMKVASDTWFINGTGVS